MKNKTIKSSSNKLTAAVVILSIITLLNTVFLISIYGAFFSKVQSDINIDSAHSKRLHEIEKKIEVLENKLKS